MTNRDLERMQKLVREYREAQAAFQAAAAALDAHIENQTLPTAAEMEAEESARARLVAARRRLYKE